MNKYNRKYLINFFILFLIIYYFFYKIHNQYSTILSIIVAYILNTNIIKNTIIYYNKKFAISSPCTGIFEISIFIAYILATPKVEMKYKIIYLFFGVIILNFINVLRIILIILYSKFSNYYVVHDAISFILFPTIAILNILWVIILKKLGKIK
ncbi:archaeosortase D [Methanocaldococcus sp.]